MGPPAAAGAAVAADSVGTFSARRGTWRRRLAAERRRFGRLVLAFKQILFSSLL